MPDTHSGINMKNHNPSNLSSQKQKSGNEIIPERRRKYLQNSEQDYSAYNQGSVNEGGDDNQLSLKKNNKLGVQLQPLEHHGSRNSSVPPMANAGGQLIGKGNPATTLNPPAIRGNVRLDSIDHGLHKLQPLNSID